LTSDGIRIDFWHWPKEEVSAAQMAR